MPGNVDYKILGEDFIFFLPLVSCGFWYPTGFPTVAFMKASTTLFVFNDNIFAGKKCISLVKFGRSWALSFSIKFVKI